MAITCVSKFQICNGAIALNMLASKPIQSLNKAQFGQGMVPQIFFQKFKNYYETPTSKTRKLRKPLTRVLGLDVERHDMHLSKEPPNIGKG